MSDKLQQAVERLRKCRLGVSLYHVYEQPISNTGREESLSRYFFDFDQVTDAYLAEHPADDDEPFTMAWVGTIGGKSDGTGDWFFIRDEETFATVRFTHDFDWNFYAEIGIDDLLQVEMKTRGDLRRLCKGLKIELKEPS